jgi:hypothetical protein
MNIFVEFWQRQRERTLDWMEDIYRYVLALIGLFFLYGICEVGRRIHYDSAKLDLLENIDFGSAVIVFLRGVFHIFGTMVVGKRPEEKPRKSAGAPKKKSS